MSAPGSIEHHQNIGSLLPHKLVEIDCGHVLDRGLVPVSGQWLLEVFPGHLAGNVVGHKFLDVFFGYGCVSWLISKYILHIRSNNLFTKNQ